MWKVKGFFLFCRCAAAFIKHSLRMRVLPQHGGCQNSSEDVIIGVLQDIMERCESVSCPVPPKSLQPDLILLCPAANCSSSDSVHCVLHVQLQTCPR